MSRHEVLTEATRCLLVCSTGRGPSVLPVACWFDGAHLWASVAADSPHGTAVRDGRECAALLSRSAGWVVAQGPVRTYGLDEPLRLALHAPAVAAAMAVLAAHHPRAVVAGAAAAARAGGLPAGRLALRLQAQRLRSLPADSLAPGRYPASGPDGPPVLGMAPGLPVEVPADVRRTVTGRRDVAVLRDDGDGFDVAAGSWDGEFRLETDGQPMPAGEEVTVVVEAGPQEEGEVAGVALGGPVDDRGRLRPSRVTWWRGLGWDSAPLSAAGSAIALPD